MTVLTHRSGAMTTYSDSSDLRVLVAELDDPEDVEHPAVAVAHPSGWTLSAFTRGLMVWENVEADGPAVHRSGLRRDEVHRLFELLVNDDLDGVRASGWQPGYGA